MKIDIKKALSALVYTLTACISLHMSAEPENMRSSLLASLPSAKVAALTQLLAQHQGASHAQQRNNLIKFVTFNNNIREFLLLQKEFQENPEKLDEILKALRFSINGYEIPPDQAVPVPVRKDKPFKFVITAQRGKIASSVALVQALVSDFKESFSDHIKNAFVKMLDVFSINISYDCPLEEQNLNNNVHDMDELVWRQPALISAFKQLSFSNLLKWAQKHMEWPDGLRVSFKLPELEKV